MNQHDPTGDPQESEAATLPVAPDTGAGDPSGKSEPSEKNGPSEEGDQVETLGHHFSRSAAVPEVEPSLGSAVPPVMSAPAEPEQQPPQEAGQELDEEVSASIDPVRQESADYDDEAAGVDTAEDDSVAAELVARSAAPAEPEDSLDAPEAPVVMNWYVLKVQSNRERTIRDSLLRRIKRDGLERYFGEIVIPTEKRVETKSGKKRVMEHKLYPGYIMINMCLNDETWYLVRDTGGVGDFTGAAGKPLPMLESEVKSMLAIKDKPDDQPAPVKINFAVGDTVKIKEGPFESFEGSINSIDEANGKVSVLIEIFGRSTPVDLEYWQVERV